MKKRYPCARCGRHSVADTMVYSTWTGNRFCFDLRACERRAKRRSSRAADVVAETAVTA